MLPPHVLWHSILEYNSPDELDSECWKLLKFISKRMASYNFKDGEDKELFKKVIRALGYKDENDFRNSSILEKNICFLKDISKLLDQKKYKRKIDRIFTSGEEVKWGKYPFKGDSLKKKFYDTVELLGLTSSSKGGRLSPKVRTLLLYLEDEADADETPVDTYLRWRREHAARVIELQGECRWGKRRSVPGKIKSTG